MAGNVGLYLLFILLELFIGYVEHAGGFKALTYLLMPMINIGGKVAVVIAGGAIGAFGISGAVVGELVTLNKMFAELLKQYEVSMIAWAVALFAAIAGGLITVAVGTVRIVQLRRAAKRTARSQ